MVLEVVLEEQPVVKAVDLQGLRDYAPQELLERMFHVSRRFTRNDTVATLRFDEERGRLSIRWPGTAVRCQQLPLTFPA